MKQSDYTAEEWKVLSEAIEEAKTFNEETDDGRDMQEVSDLLNDAINSIIDVKEESDIDSLFSAGGTSALMSEISGLDDFELICFLVVKWGGAADTGLTKKHRIQQEDPETEILWKSLCDTGYEACLHRSDQGDLLALNMQLQENLWITEPFLIHLKSGKRALQ